MTEKLMNATAEKLMDPTTRKVMIRTIDEHPEVFGIMTEAIRGFCNGTINTLRDYEKAIAPAVDILEKLRQEEEANAEDNENAAD